jgi:hypothetical protein
MLFILPFLSNLALFSQQNKKQRKRQDDLLSLWLKILIERMQLRDPSYDKVSHIEVRNL